MKKILCGILLFYSIVFFCEAEGIAESSRRDRETIDLSYAFGMFIASDLMDTGLDISNSAFTQGFRDFMESRETRFSVDEALDILQTAFQRLEALEWDRIQAEAEQNLILGEAFLAENAQRPGVIVNPSGLQFEILSEGDGDYPNIADTVWVHYRGTLIDGTVFDSTYDYSEPVTFPLDAVIPGWSEGLRMMKEGSRAMLYLPPELAYGDMNVGNIIAPNSVLIFEVELLEIIR